MEKLTVRQKKIKKALKDIGHKNVIVWYEPLGRALEMCGREGGWFFSSDEIDEEILGENIETALSCVSTKNSYNGWYFVQ